MVINIQNAVLTETGRVHFDLPFDQPKLSDSNRGWSIDGDYWTTTDSKGDHSLNIDGTLTSPIPLDPKKPHYVGFCIESDFKV